MRRFNRLFLIPLVLTLNSPMAYAANYELGTPFPMTCVGILSKLGHGYHLVRDNNYLNSNSDNWPAPGSEDTELGVFMGPEVSHGETKVYAGVQA